MSEAAAKWLAVAVLVAAVAVFAIFVIGGEGNDTDADSVSKVWSGEVDDPPAAALDHPDMTDKRDWPNRRHRSDSRHWFDKPDRAGRPGGSGGPGWGLDHQRPMMPDGKGWMMPPGFDDDGEGWMGRWGGEMGPGRMGSWFGERMFGPSVMPGHGGPMMPGRDMCDMCDLCDSENHLLCLSRMSDKRTIFRMCYVCPTYVTNVTALLRMSRMSDKRTPHLCRVGQT